MFFRGKTRNRRLKREDVLEVKLRSAIVRKERLRLASGVIIVALTLVLGGLLLWRGGAWLVEEMVYRNEAFTIRRIVVETDGVLAPDQIRRWARVQAQDNLLALDLKRVKRDLELVPLIQSVSLERALPHTLLIRVSERVPVAQVFTIRQSPVTRRYEPFIYHLDAQGYVMLPLDARLRAEPVPPGEWFPSLTGLPGTELRPGRAVESPQAHAALRLIQAFESSPMAGVVDLKHIDVGTPEVLKVTSGQGNEVIFGLTNFEAQFQRWRSVHDYAQRAGRRIGQLDLSVANNVPALWAQHTEAVPPAPKAKPSRTRKKNV